MTCMDKVKTVFSCGCYYLYVVSQKRKVRPSVVLTTHRLLEVTPAVDDGCATFLPGCIQSCCFPITRGMVIRSLYPKWSAAS